MKVQISVPDELLKRIDAYSAENYLTRSGFLALASTQYLNAADVTMGVKGLAVAMRKIADNGVIDEESKRKLEDFERLAKVLTGA